VNEVHVIVPEGLDDPARPSGGNTYGRRVCDGLAARGWVVHEHAVGDLARIVRAIPDGSVVLLDGLIASPAADVLVPHAERLRQVVLLHMPIEDARERAVLTGAAGVVVTSEWTRGRVHELYGLSAVVATPGVELAEIAPGTVGGGELLCVAAGTPHKGHDVLFAALATLTDFDWRCTCVGRFDHEPLHGLGDRVRFTGPLVGADLDRAYAEADLLVLSSRAETYGMVVTEALARAVPVIASDVGGVSEALGHGGLLVPPGDAPALGAALRAWLGDTELRARLRRAARERRASLRGWEDTTAEIARVLAGAARDLAVAEVSS
jgi:glycosyltransferase involved in cell wall biosynthesis